MHIPWPHLTTRFTSYLVITYYTIMSNYNNLWSRDTSESPWLQSTQPTYLIRAPRRHLPCGCTDFRRTLRRQRGWEATSEGWWRGRRVHPSWLEESLANMYYNNLGLWRFLIFVSLYKNSTKLFVLLIFQTSEFNVTV